VAAPVLVLLLPLVFPIFSVASLVLFFVSHVALLLFVLPLLYVLFLLLFFFYPFSTICSTSEPATK
jgi:hypothetical protein